MRFWRLETELDGPAQRALPLLREALSEAGAVITDARQLGGLALVFRFECDDEAVIPIRAALVSVAPLRGEAAPAEGEGEICGSLHATLVGSDEKVVIPNVPGE